MNTHNIHQSETLNTSRPLVFAGSFDPWTHGHESVVNDYFHIFPEGRLKILVAKHPTKKYTFTAEERKFLIEKTLPEDIRGHIDIEIFEGVIADYVYENDCAGILKGVRNGEDFEYEATMAHANSYFSGKVKTIILPQVIGDMSRISSSVTKLIESYGGNTNDLVSPLVQESLKMRRTGQWLVGVTGGTGCGKTTLSRKLAEYSQDKEVPIFHIDVDTLVYELYQKPTTPLMHTIRHQMIQAFGNEIIDADETVNRKILGNVVFSNGPKKKLLESIVGTAFLHQLRKKVDAVEGKGIILLDWALFAEYKKTQLCNENLVVVSVPTQKQKERIQTRDSLSVSEIELRMKNQLSETQRKDIIRASQEGNYDRLFLEVDGGEYDVEVVYKKLKEEYLKRKNIIR